MQQRLDQEQQQHQQQLPADSGFLIGRNHNFPAGSLNSQDVIPKLYGSTSAPPLGTQSQTQQQQTSEARVVGSSRQIGEAEAEASSHTHIRLR